MAHVKFQPGDRVAVYDGGKRFEDTFSFYDCYGKAATMNSVGRYHPKQLRKLKPKPRPKEPVREATKTISDKHYECLDGQLRELLSIINSLRWDLSNMPEKLPNTVTVTRESLAKIVFEACKEASSCETMTQLQSVAWRHTDQALGLPEVTA